MRFSVLAYADDTMWIAENKSQLRKITEIASDFFRINDIQINGKKSKLLILNSSLRKEERFVQFENAIVQAESIETTTRFLGCG